MHKSVFTYKSWLFTVVIILFLLQIIVFSLGIEITYSGRSENPNHTLTYTEKKLVWDTATNINDQGVAELTPFNAQYKNSKAVNNDNIIAPGTSGGNIIRLKNESSDKISYTAVLYKIKTDINLPVKVSLNDGNFSDTSEPVLPNEVNDKSVIRAVKGMIGSKERQDFDIAWLWDYYDDNIQDKYDTNFGNLSANKNADEVKIGFYIVVEEDGRYISPGTPKTGDNTMIEIFIICFAVNAAILIAVIIYEYLKNKRRNETN